MCAGSRGWSWGCLLYTSTSVEEIHKAYRELARKYHPDVCREQGAQERFCLINDAHDTLAKPEKRVAYDAAYALRNAA